MPTEWIDIADTAVKIGFGALISGVATYKLTSLSHSQENHKETQSRVRDLIEAGAEEADKYINSLSFFYSALDGLVKNNQSVKDGELSDGLDLWELSVKKDSELTNSRQYVNSAETKLRLAGAVTAVAEITKMRGIEHVLRFNYLRPRVVPEQESLNAIGAQYAEVKKILHTELNKSYMADST